MTDCVGYEETLQTGREERNILQTVNRRKVNWIGHILRINCLLKHVIDVNIQGKMAVTGRRERRHGQLLDDLKENRGS